MSILDSIKRIFNPPKKQNRSISFSTAFGSSVNVGNDTALTFTAVWSAIRLLSESVSSLPLSVYEKQKDGNTEELTKSPIYNLLKYKPNPYQNKITFLEKIMMDLCTNGNSYVFISRNNNATPVNLFPLNYDDVTILKQDNQLYYDDASTGDTYNSEEILHFTGITTDGINGLSPISQCKNAISWGLAIEEYGNTFFKNGAKLSGTLSTDRALSETAIDRLRSSFNNTYSKLTGANQTAILEEGLTFKPISIPPDQAQFLTSRQFSIEEVARIFNVPPHMLKDLTKSSFNNIEMQSQEFVTYTLMPYLTRIENEMNLKLFKQSELGRVYTEFNVNALLRGDVKSRTEAYKAAITNGYMSINEVRQKENMNSIDGGDKHFMPLNMTTIEKIGEEDATA